MVEKFRGFRYQTGEIKEIAEKLKEGDIVQVDIDYDSEIPQVINDLKKQGIFPVDGLEYDYDALNGEEEPEFEVRIGFFTEKVKKDQINKEDIMFIDFFIPNEEEDPYGVIF